MLIFSVCCRKGRIHDFNIFKNSKVKINPKTKKIVDLGYLGIDKICNNIEIPIKKRKNKSLTEEDKKYNKKLSKIRVKIEHVNRRCKIFRIVKDKYRNKHKNYSKVWNVIVALVNLRYVL
ncbi:MAG: transposase [Candidatus Dojkabacteria bacterium]|nr:transposase [Candidatus Dojkabacteria bacterium]